MSILWVLPTANEDDPSGWATMILATDNEDDSLEMNILQYWLADYDNVFNFNFLKKHVYCVCLFVSMYSTCLKYSRKPEEMVRSPRTRVTGGYKKHCVGAGIEPGSSTWAAISISPAPTFDI